MTRFIEGPARRGEVAVQTEGTDCFSEIHCFRTVSVQRGERQRVVEQKWLNLAEREGFEPSKGF
jgi:hypothetical protein